MHSTVLLKKLRVLSQTGIPMPCMVHEGMFTKDHQWTIHLSQIKYPINIPLLTLFYHACIKSLHMFFSLGNCVCIFHLPKYCPRTVGPLIILCLQYIKTGKLKNFNNQNILTWPVEQDCQWTAFPTGEQWHYIVVIHRRRRSEVVFCSLVWVHFVSPIQGHNPGAQP